MNRIEIKELRKRLRMSQQEFAAKLGITTITVLRWEKGHSEPSNMALSKLNEINKSVAVESVAVENG